MVASPQDKRNLTFWIKSKTSIPWPVDQYELIPPEEWKSFQIMKAYVENISQNEKEKNYQQPKKAIETNPPVPVSDPMKNYH